MLICEIILFNDIDCPIQGIENKVRVPAFSSRLVMVLLNDVDNKRCNADNTLHGYVCESKEVPFKEYILIQQDCDFGVLNTYIAQTHEFVKYVFFMTLVKITIESL